MREFFHNRHRKDHLLVVISILFFFVYILFTQNYSPEKVQQESVLSSQSSQYTCTTVIGYSQVGISPETISGYGEGWYVAPNQQRVFESIVEDTKWQLLWDSGHGVDQWQNPNAQGWSKWTTKELPFFQSACTTNSSTPDRIVFSISAGYGSDEDAWRRNIEAAVTTIIAKIPSVRQIILQPVVGGPSHQTCPCTAQMQSTITSCSYGPTVRASWQHKHIDNAIQLVLADIARGTYQPGRDIIAGYSPEVRSCSDYYDSIGHLTTEGASVVGRATAAYYASNNSDSPASPTQIKLPIPSTTSIPTSDPTNVPEIVITNTPIPLSPTTLTTQEAPAAVSNTPTSSVHPFLVPRSYSTQSSQVYAAGCKSTGKKIIDVTYFRCVISKLISTFLKK